MKTLTASIHPPHRLPRLRRHLERGQAIVEFALVMPVLVILLFGVVFFAMAFNLQMVLNGAAREGARAWASGRANTSPCCATCTTICDPTSANNGFQKNVVPLVRKYVADNGYDGNQVIFEVVQASQTDLSPAQWNQIEDGAEDATKVKLVISFPFYLPTPGFEIKLVHLRAESTFKRGT
jgi:Flp pilus assembly protein TadG